MAPRKSQAPIPLAVAAQAAAMAVLALHLALAGANGWITGLALLFLALAGESIALAALAASVLVFSYRVLCPAAHSLSIGWSDALLVLLGLACWTSLRVAAIPWGKPVPGAGRLPSRWWGFLAPAALVLGLGLLLAGMFRTVPLAVLPLGWCWLALGLSRSNPTGEALRFRDWGRAGALLLGGILAGAVIIEGGLRLAFPSPVPAGRVHKPHGRAVFTLNPGGKATYTVPTEKHGGGFQVEARVSSQGFRDEVLPPKEPGEFRIYMAGDSFTLGAAVEQEDTIPHQLETILRAQYPGRRISTVNGGIGGGGPWQHLVLLEERGLAMAPDLAVLQLFPTNDLDDSLQESGRMLRAYNEQWRRTLRSYRKGYSLPHRMENTLYRHCATYRILTHTLVKRRWLTHLAGDFRLIHESDFEPLPPNARRPFIIETELDKWYPELEAGLAELGRYVEAMRDLCQSRDIPLVAYCMPNCLVIYDQGWRQMLAQVHDGSAYDRGKGIRKTEALLAEMGIPTIPIQAALKDTQNPSAYYYLLDGHLTPKGNALVAERIAAFLSEAGYLD